MSAASEWWDDLPEEDKDAFDRIARDSILELDHCPRDLASIQELLAWQVLENDVLEAHADWQSRTKARYERLGIEWTVENINSRSHLWEHE